MTVTLRALLNLAPWSSSLLMLTFLLACQFGGKVNKGVW